MVEYARQVGQFSRNVRLLLTANLLVNAGIGFFVVLFNLYLHYLCTFGGAHAARRSARSSDVTPA